MATVVVGVNLNFASVLSDSSPSFRPCLLLSSCSVRAPLQRPTIEAKKELTRRETIEISHTRIRKKLSGTPERPRLAVFRSNQHIYAQVIDDTKGFPLVSASTIPKALRDELNFSAGPMIAARARVRSDAIKKKQAVVELKDDNELEEKEDEHREEGTVEAEVSEDSKKSYPDMAAFLDEAFKDDREVQEIIEKSFDDPEEMGKRVNERVKKKKKDILQSKTGSAIPMKVSFSNFDATDSYIWMELYNSPSEKDIDIIGSVVRSWYLLGCLGAYNSLNMQLTKIPVNDRLSYNENIEDDIIPARFNNIGELEFQHNWGRFWVDLGTSDPLALDVLVNSFANVSSDYVGIKEVTFGGKDIGRWDEAITSEEDGCLSYKI